MNRATIVCLKVLIAVLIGLLLVCQVLVIPATAAGMASRYPEFGDLQVPGTLVGIAFTLCAQVLLVCVWRLLSLVGVDSIFTTRAFVWVDVCLAVVVVASLLVVAALALLSAAGAAAPSIAILCIVGIVVGAGLSLLIVVLRGLLRKATQLEQDLSEVV